MVTHQKHENNLSSLISTHLSNVPDEAYRAVISKGIFVGSSITNLTTGAAKLSPANLDTAYGGAYSCSLRVTLQSAGKAPIPLYQRLNHIPGTLPGGAIRQPGAANYRDAMIAFPVAIFSALADIELRTLPVPTTIAQLNDRKTFKAAHCAIRRKDGHGLSANECILISEMISVAYRVVTSNNF